MKITKFYIDRAVYRAGDDFGREILMEVDYWNGSYKISDPNKKLEKVARELLRKKRGVNFADKLLK